MPPPCRETADEHAVVEKVRLHSDAVAEDRPAAERARGIDRDDPHGGALAAQPGDQAVDERRFPGTGRSRDPDDVRSARVLVDGAHDLASVGVAILDSGDQFGERHAVALEHAGDQRLPIRVVHQRPL